MSKTFEIFTKDFSEKKIESMDKTYDDVVNYLKTSSVSVRTAKAKATRNAKKINALRQEAMTKFNLSVNEIYDLSIDALTKLINGEIKRNECGSFVPV